MTKNKNYLGILGSKGFVGSALSRYCKKEKISYIGITRKNFTKFQNYKFKFIINCAMPSKRFWAKKFPVKDYEETVLKTKFFLDNMKFDKFIHISSVSARLQLNTNYGNNKKKAENLVKKKNFFTIYRLASMYGKGLVKGVLIDLMCSSKVYLNKKSKYSFTDVNLIAKFIISNLKKFRNKNLEIGCNDYYDLYDLKKDIKSKSKFKGLVDNQILKKNKINKYFGTSKNVLIFLNKIMSN